MSIRIEKLPVDAQVHQEIQNYKTTNNGQRPQSFDMLSTVPQGLTYFNNLLNHQNNPIATAHYGGGVHAIEAKHILKYDLWGARILTENTLACFFAFEDDNTDPVGYVNLGLTGGTVKYNKLEKEVIEFGAFFADSTFANDSNKATIAEAMAEMVKYISTEVEEDRMTEYGAIMGTFSKDHPWANQFLPKSMILVTKENYEDIFGKEPFAATRFQFNQNDSLEECTNWDTSGACTDWVEKDMYAISFYE